VIRPPRCHPVYRLVEHSGAKELIAQLEDMSPDDELYDAKEPSTEGGANGSDQDVEKNALGRRRARGSKQFL
jgi:hypothetical protein